MPNGNPETWWDDEWQAYVWWSGTEGCETSVHNFDTEMTGIVPDILNYYEGVTGDSATITGGDECNGCHTTGSRHCCGKAIDIDVNQMTAQQRQDFADWADVNVGCSLLEESESGGWHVHASTEACQVQ